MKNKISTRIGTWNTPPCIRKCLTSLKALTLLLVMLMSVNVWGADTYERLTSIANIDESAQYVLGIDGTGFHYEGTSSWGKTALPSAQTPLYYTLKKANDEKSFTAQTTISSTTYYLQIPTSNTFGMATSTGTNTDLIIGTTFDAGDDKGYAVANKGTTTRHLRRNGDSGLRSYASGTGALAFFYKVVKDEKTLVSIAISGNPTKTTYETGESFDVTGLTVTGTYTKGDPEVITSGIDWTITPATFTSTSQNSVSVTAKVGKITSPAYQVDGLTVTEFVQTYANTYTSDASLSEIVKDYKVKWEGSKVEEGYAAYKFAKAGTVEIPVPAGTKTVHLHMVAWNGESNAVAVKLGSTALSSITPTADAGVSGSSTTYTIATEPKTEDSYYFAIEVNADEATTLSLTTASGKRAILFGVNFEADTKPSISASDEEIEFEQKELSGTVTDSKVISATGKNLTAAISASMKSGSAAVFSVVANGTPTAAAGEFTVSYSTTEAGEYAGTVVLSSGETSLEIPVSASVVAHIPVLQSVAVSGTPTKTNYTEGDAFETAGLVVTGTYDVGDPQTITEGIEWTVTPSGALAANVTSVSVVATVGDVASPAFNVDITVAKAPSIVTWNLSIVDDELTTASEDKLEWTNAVATMTDTRKDSKSTAANNYYPGTSGKTYTSTRFYSGSTLVITPLDNNVITKVEFTATQESYATALQNSTWTNASASVSNTTLVTVTPTDGKQAFSATIDGTCGFTAVKVYYQPGATMTSIAVTTAPSKVVYNAGESFNPAGLVITATYDDASTKDITYDANDTKWSFNPALDVALNATNTQVTITYDGKTAASKQTITVNRIASNLVAVSATKILVVNDMPDVTEWYTIATNYDGTVAFQSDDEDVFYAENGEGLALAAGSATLTITAPQTGTYAQASVTVAVTVNAAAVPCSVKWMNNGEEYTAGDPSTVVNAGQKVTKLPTAPEPCDAQHVFKGWTNAIIATPQADAPSVLFTDVAGAPTVDADNTVYYAVYAIESIDEDIDSYTFTGVGTVTEGVTTLTTSSGNTIRMDKGEGANPPAWSSNQARLYAYGIMTVSSSDKISKVVYTYKKNASSSVIPDLVSLEGNNSDAGSHNSETDASNVTTTTWTSSTNAAKAVTMTLGGTKGNYGFTNVTIYTAGELVYSDYSTTCAAIELDAIELGGTYPTTFLVGDEFSHEGMTVTASYTNSSTTKDVTNLATFSGYDANTLGEQTITVSYTEGEGVDAITETATYKVTVNDLPTMTIAQFLANPSKCYLSGIVSNITNTTYGNYTLTDASGNAEIYGTLTPSKESKQFATLGIVEGDKIKVIAENYSTEHSNITDVIFVEEFAFSAIAVSGTMNVTEYTEGNTLSSEGLVVKGKYADEDEATHVITEGITWNMPTAVLGTSEYDVTATVGTLPSPAYHVTGITVNAAKVLTGIVITNEPKKTFWVGENFSTEGIQVKASYDGAEDADVTALCSFSRAEAQITDAIVNETITVSYTEGTETKTATYTINANWMTLADLVAKGQPSTTAVKVWVKVTDAVIKAKNASYITTDVTYGDNQTQEVKFYKSNSVPSDWEEGGKITGNLTDVDWKFYSPDWELCPTNWTWVTNYVAPEHTPVTGVSLNTNVLSITQGKKEQLTATVAPADAYDKAVTWSITADNASGKITVSDAGLVSVAADATVGATATVQVKTHDGNFTATCVVTVTAPQKKYFALATSIDDINAAVTNGKKVVIAPNINRTENVVMGTYLTGNNIGEMAATYADERLALEVTEDAFYTIAKDGDYYTFRDGNGKYIYAAGGTGSNNYLKAKEELEANGKWSVTIDATTKNATIKTSDATVARHTIYYNDGNDFFSCYATAQKAIALYVEAEKPVYVPVESIELNETSAEVMVGKKLTLTATVGPDNATQKGVTWASNNEKVTVDANGLVTVDAEAEVGLTATITATTVGTTTDGGTEHLSATCTITVTKLVGTRYGLVSNINTLYDGAVVVLGAVYEKNSEMKYAVSGAIGTGKFMASVDVAAADYADEVMLSTGATEITLHKVEEGWTMTSDEGNIYLSSSDIKVSTTQAATVWTISIENGVATIKSGTGTTRIEYNSTDPRFKMYSNQKPIGIYLKNLVAVRNNLTAGKIATYCEARGASIYDGAAFFEMLSKDAEVKNVTLQEALSLSAGMPYIIEPSHNILKVVFKGDAVTEATNKNGLYGWLGETRYFDSQIDGKDAYLVSGGRIVRCGDNCTLLSNRAYVVLEDVQYEGVISPIPGRRCIRLATEGSAVATGCEDALYISNDSELKKVVVDGQFFIIRNGKVFDAQGKLVK